MHAATLVQFIDHVQVQLYLGDPDNLFSLEGVATTLALGSSIEPLASLRISERRPWVSIPPIMSSLQNKTNWKTKTLS